MALKLFDANFSKGLILTPTPTAKFGLVQQYHLKSRTQVDKQQDILFFVTKEKP